MGRFRHYRGGGHSPNGWRPAGVRRRPDLIGTIRSAVAESDPLALLLLASTILDIADGPDPGDETLSRDVLIESFVDTACPETSAVLAVIGELCDDETLRAKIRRTLATRWDWLPPWLSDLDRAMPFAAVEIGQVLGNGDHVVVGVRLSDDSEFSVVVYIDHSMGSVARNAFAMAQPINQLIGFPAREERWSRYLVEDARFGRRRGSDQPSERTGCAGTAGREPDLAGLPTSRRLGCPDAAVRWHRIRSTLLARRGREGSCHLFLHPLIRR